jgi:hypothetical protein
MDWQSLPQWARYGIGVIIATILSVLITLFREALIGFLRRLGEYLSKLRRKPHGSGDAVRTSLLWLRGDDMLLSRSRALRGCAFDIGVHSERYASTWEYWRLGTGAGRTPLRPEEARPMNPPRWDDLDSIHFLIAAQKVFTCTEAARWAPEGERVPAHDALTRLLQL